MSVQELSIERRRDILQKEIGRYIRKGFRVVSQTDTSAQLVKPKRFSLLWAIIWLILAVLPFILYLLWYWSRKDQVVYLTVDTQGRISKS
ncbi:MAG: hypothetical protein ABSF61_13540 [Anaerolineales bacterium]|jgi:hypothetical protein